MPEIIKHGKFYGRHIICQKCGCEFIAHDNEYSYVEKSLNGKRMIRCPECGAEIWLTNYTNDYKPNDWTWIEDENTFRIHPEDDPTYKYYDIHVDKYDLSKKFNFDTTYIPDDYTDYISKINSIDNYKLPDDYEIVEKRPKDE